MQQVVAIVNHKGGVGKTTSTVKIAACWGEIGKRVLVIDLDPQGSATVSFGITDDGTALLNALQQTAALPVVSTKAQGVDLVPAGHRLAEARQRFVGTAASELLMRCLRYTEGEWDFVIADCPPSLGIFTMNALKASAHVLIPVEANHLSYLGLTQMMQAVNSFRSDNPVLTVRAIIPCRAQARRRIHEEFLAMMEKVLPGGISPSVRENVSLAEAPGRGLPVVLYFPNSNGAYDYRRVAQWLLERIPN
jgi:chromosome partitioning protein